MRPEEICSTRFEESLEDLRALVRIPSVSFDGFPAAEVRRSADAVAALLKKRGLENVELLEVPGAHPYVVGDWLHAPGKPTVLLYAHHDVQPPGRAELWQTPPFEPTLKEGPGGQRLYGRGTADDKAGIIVHTAAIDAWLKATGKLPLNVKVVIEGEEETGSEHLGEFLRRYRERLAADVLVLTDTANFDCGVPTLTVSLRGLVAVEVEVRAATKALHSGLWGGPVPDPVQALSKMIAALTDAEGRIAIPGMLDGLPPVTPEEERRLKAIPFDEAAFREAGGLVKGARLLKEGPNPAAQLFRFPSLVVTAIQASSRAQAGNIINDAAWAKVTVRLAAGMDPERCGRLLKEYLAAKCPWGLEVSFPGRHGNSAPWAIDPTGPAFEAATEAMRKGYGRDVLMIGCGASIPFVRPFAEALGGAPALLVGVEDPHTNAHGENESLLVSDLRKACVSQTHLFEEIARRVPAGANKGKR